MVKMPHKSNSLYSKPKVTHYKDNKSDCTKTKKKDEVHNGTKMATCKASHEKRFAFPQKPVKLKHKKSNTETKCSTLGSTNKNIKLSTKNFVSD